MAADTAAESSGLRQRVLAAIVFVPVILLLVEGASWGIFLLVLAVAVRCSWEYHHILEEAGYRPIRLPGSLLVLGLCTYFWRQGIDGIDDDLVALLMAAIVAGRGVGLVRGHRALCGQRLSNIGRRLLLRRLG